MMYFLLILFFGSLLGITFMIGRKLVMTQNGILPIQEENFLKVQYLEEWKHQTVKNVRKHGYTLLVATIRFHLRSTNFLKNKYQEVKTKIENARRKNSNGEVEKRKVNKFLKMISEYKHKIREIKHKIKEEENL